MAFPGGRRSDAADSDLLETALRETREEIGLDLDSSARLVGRLPDHVPGTWRRKDIDLFIRPYVFCTTKETLEIKMNAEVTEIVWTPIAPLMRGEKATVLKRVFDDVSYELPGFDLDGRVVWGITLRMLVDVFERLRKEL